jgi:hypothetical protein
VSDITHITDITKFQRIYTFLWKFHNEINENLFSPVNLHVDRQQGSNVV